MQGSKHQEANLNITNFINNVLTDLKNLTNSLRSVSKPAADTNNSIINRLLLGNDRDSLQLSKAILSHLLHIVQYKGVNTLILSILAKVIGFIKIIDQSESKNEDKMFERTNYSQQMNTILYHIIDIIVLLKNKYKDIDMALRIIQTTFSLIDSKILQYANENIFIRIYSICFDCCLSSPVIQNISVSALFALTEIIFSNDNIEPSLSILDQFLEFIFNNKKYSWIKELEFKGIVWDLIIVAIKSYPTREIEALATHKNVPTLINVMYKTAMTKVFLHIEETKSPAHTNKVNKKQNDKNINFKKGSFPDFIRYYKSFIYFSIHLSIRSFPIFGEIVPFRQNLHLFKVLNELQRGTKLYILLEGLSLLIIEGNNILIDDDKGIILLDVICKIVEELCLSPVLIDLSSDSKDFYLEKMCGDFSKINDSDHARLIKNLIIKLRKKFQKSLESKAAEGQLRSQRSQLSEKSQVEAEHKQISDKKKWQRLIKIIISIIRYLTSVNMNESANEQVVRKLIIEFQYWFLICPSSKTRNFILQELLNTSTLMDTKLQAIKVSQCVQLGSNIIYGYYDVLDSLGLTIIIKMMAGVKTSWEEGKGFEELDEVCSMSEKLYSEQRLVHNEKSFMKTIQAIVQSANSMLADLQQPSKQEQKAKRIGRSPQEKFLKLIEYIFNKLNIILEENIEYLSNEWNFLTGFWISFCSNKSIEIQNKTMSHLGSIIPVILKKSEINQQLILSTYIELAKLQIPSICKLIIQHIKIFISNINSEQGILQLFRIIKIIIQNRENKAIFEEIYEVQEMIIKESLFKIKSIEKIISIIDSITILNNDKNEEYKIVNLIWSIFDHMKLMAGNQQIQECSALWMKLFNKIYLLALYSVYGETKQSCIHTFTQLLAESTSIIKLQLFQEVLHHIYMPLFLVVLGIHQKVVKIENQAQAQMMKVGIKNLSKIIRKCINEKVFTYQSILNEISHKILEFMQAKGKQSTIEYFHELCAYFEFIKALKEGQSQKQQIDIKTIQSILTQMQKYHDNFDKSSVYWRKRYEPAFVQIKQYFFKD